MSCEPVATLQGHFRSIDDPRVVPRCKHRLLDVIAMAVCAMIGGADDWESIAQFAQARKPFFDRILGLQHGVPSTDTFSRVFSLINSEQFERSFRQWVMQSLSADGMKYLAIDGKTIRRSHNKKLGAPPLHIVSAYASEAGLVLAQEKVDDKSNEITAIPRLLEHLELEGSTVTIDAMGCQKTIAEKIVENKGNYVIGLKGNQPKLHEQVKAQFQHWVSSHFTGAPVDWFEQTEKNRDRTEIRRVWCSESLEAIPQAASWPSIRSIIMVESVRRTADHESVDQRYYVSSSAPDAERLAQAIRQHWSIENSVHWVLDMTFAEDQSRVRERQAAENLSLLRKIAMNIVRADKTKKASMRGKRRIAGWDEEYLAILLKTLAV